MALTAREWLLLPEEEQKIRGKELSPEECFKLRMELSMIHFTEDEKRNMSEQRKYEFTHPKESTSEEKAAFNKIRDEIFEKMIKEAEKRKDTSSQ